MNIKCYADLFEEIKNNRERKFYTIVSQKMEIRDSYIKLKKERAGNEQLNPEALQS